MAISLLGISSNSYVAYSTSIAFYIERAVNWKNNQLCAFYHNQAYPIHHNQLSNQEQKSHKENWKNWEQQKNKKREREKYTSCEQPVRRWWNSGTGERIPRWWWTSGWIISPLSLSLSLSLSKLSSNFLPLSHWFRLFSFDFYSQVPLTWVSLLVY